MRRHHVNQFGPTPEDKIERRFPAGKRRTEQMDRLGQHRLGRNQPPPEFPVVPSSPLQCNPPRLHCIVKRNAPSVFMAFVSNESPDSIGTVACRPVPGVEIGGNSPRPVGKKRGAGQANSDVYCSLDRDTSSGPASLPVSVSSRTEESQPNPCTESVIHPPSATGFV